MHLSKTSTDSSLTHILRQSKNTRPGQICQSKAIKLWAFATTALTFAGPSALCAGLPSDPPQAVHGNLAAFDHKGDILRVLQYRHFGEWIARAHDEIGEFP